jgi:hypothetical protein
MPAPSKFVIGYGLLAKLEASYNAGGSPSTATDGVLLEELAQLKFSYANDGARPAPPGTAGYQTRVRPSGRAVELTAKVAPKGAGAAYSASVLPNVHALLRASGMDAVINTTGGSESVTYTPTPLPSAGYGSDVMSFYGRQQLYLLQGMLGDWSLELAGPTVPVLTLAMKGLAPTQFSDSALPAITYPALSIDPPKATSIAFVYGSVTPVVRRVSLKLARAINPRLDINAGGHVGFAPGRRTPQLDVEVETAALAGAADWWNDFDTALGAAISFTVGSVQYNKYSITCAKAQLMQPPEESNDGEVSITKLSFQLNPSALNASDEISWVFN